MKICDEIKHVRIEGVVAYIELTQGREAIIDASDIPLVSDCSWALVATSPGAVYARSSKKQYMHRVITGAPKGMVVDHLNHDTLDNRRTNLRVGGQRENGLNRLGANKNSTTGVLGVNDQVVTKRGKHGQVWQTRYYYARIMVDGHSVTKCFPHTEEGLRLAAAAAIEMRQKVAA